MFERIPDDTQLSDWDGVHSDSYSTGVLIKLSRDGEEANEKRYNIR